MLLCLGLQCAIVVLFSKSAVEQHVKMQEHCWLVHTQFNWNVRVDSVTQCCTCFNVKQLLPDHF